MQVYYTVDQEAMERHQQFQLKPAAKQKCPSSSSTKPSAVVPSKRPAPAAAAQAADGSSGAADDEDGGSYVQVSRGRQRQPKKPKLSLDDKAKQLVMKGLLAVCPRQPNGRFIRKMDFEEKLGGPCTTVWRAFVRRLTSDIMQRGDAKYANKEFDEVFSAVNEDVNQ